MPCSLDISFPVSDLSIAHTVTLDTLSKLKYLTALQVCEQVSYWQSTRLLALLIQEVLSSAICTKHHATGKEEKKLWIPLSQKDIVQRKRHVFE